MPKMDGRKPITSGNGVMDSERIVDGKRKSCLVTSLAHPSWSNALSLLADVSRRRAGCISGTNFLPPDKLPRGFNPARPYGIVPDKPAKRKVPEWRISFADIVDFYQRMAASRNENLIDTRFERPDIFCPRNTRARHLRPNSKAAMWIARTRRF